MSMETASSLLRKQMSEFSKAEQIAQSQEEIMKIREARLARLLFLHAEAQKDHEIYSMETEI